MKFRDVLNDGKFGDGGIGFQHGIGPGVRPGNPCFDNGEASLAVRKELAAGAVLVSSLGYTVAYSTLDNNRNPTSGLYAEFKQDFAGVRGDVNFIRSTGGVRTYHELFSDVVAVAKVQAGHIAGWGRKDRSEREHFHMWPN